MPKGGPGQDKSETHRAKIRAWWTPERKEAHRKKLLARKYKHSPSTKKKISEANIGKPGTVKPGHLLGRKFTAEHKRKISESLMGNTRSLGRKLSEEQKIGIGLRHRGVPKSSETKRKMKEAWTPEKRAAAGVRFRKMAAERGSGEMARIAKIGWTDERRAKHRAALAMRHASQSDPKYDTKPELAMRKILEDREEDFEAQVIIYGAPNLVWDFVIRSKRVLIEVDGCYWHGCKKCGFVAREEVVRRDKAKVAVSKRLGWKLFRIKEHHL